MSEVEMTLVLNTLIYSEGFAVKQLRSISLCEAISSGLITRPSTVTDKEWE